MSVRPIKFVMLFMYHKSHSRSGHKFSAKGHITLQILKDLKLNFIQVIFLSLECA